MRACPNIKNVAPIADYLELALQFGMIMMFACAFPLVFCSAILVYILLIAPDLISSMLLVYIDILVWMLMFASM